MPFDLRNHLSRWCLGDDDEVTSHQSACGAPAMGFMALRHVTCIECLRTVSTYSFVRMIELQGADDN